MDCVTELAGGIEPALVNSARLLEIVGLPSRADHDPTSPGASAGELIRVVVSVVDSLILLVIAKRTALDFASARAAVFPQYFAAMRSLGDLVRIMVPRTALRGLTEESFSELEADLRDLGPSAFGLELTERGLFTVWTLRKIEGLAEQIEKLVDGRKADEKISAEFVLNAVWSRFHVNCLVKSMHLGKPIFPEVVDTIDDGLRAGVNAYAWIKQAVDSHAGPTDEELAPVEWEDEDEHLLMDSMRDLGLGSEPY